MAEASMLVDSSAWIEFFNRPESDISAVIREQLVKDSIAICGPVITEVLRGARTSREAQIIGQRFGILHYLNLEKEDFVEAASLGFSLARKGVTAATVDLLVSHLAMRENAIVLHRDQDLLGLRSIRHSGRSRPDGSGFWRNRRKKMHQEVAWPPRRWCVS